MKKEYITPNIEITEIMENDVIMVSGLTKNTGFQQTINSVNIDF